MEPIKHDLCNDVLRRPADMTEEECGDLHISRTYDDGIHYVHSFWKPEPEELAALLRGGVVCLRAIGMTHPPVAIFATKPDDFDPLAGFSHIERLPSGKLVLGETSDVFPCSRESILPLIKSHNRLAFITGAGLVQASAMADVLEERARQFEKWGEQNHKLSLFHAILSEEVGGLAAEILELELNENQTDNLRVEAVQVAAVALQIIERIDRGTRGPNPAPAPMVWTH